MKQTIALKLHPTPENAQALRATMHAYNAACNFVAGVAFEQETSNKLTLQKLCYRDVRAQFDLSAQLAVLSIRKASTAFAVARILHKKRLKETARKNAKRVQKGQAPLEMPVLRACRFRPDGAITYDRRCMSYRGLEQVSLLTLQGRVLVPFTFGAYQAQHVARIRGEADLVLRDGQLYLHQTVESPEPPIEPPKEFLGVDLGVTNLAVDSDGEVHCAKSLNCVRVRYARMRRKLQKKGTRAAKRLLRKRRRKEQRFASWTNHNLSKHIVQKAKDTHRGISVENLTDIRDRVTVRKGQRLLHHSWSFGQLGQFLEYKAKLAGVMLVAVDARNTSRTCPACGCVDKRNRPSQAVFRCIECDCSGHADTFAAIEISRRATCNLAILADAVEGASL